MGTKKTDVLNYERAIEVLRYDAQKGVLERRLKSGRWKICGHKPVSHGYGTVRIDGIQYFAHRVIWLLVHGECHEFIDHIDRNPMNNRLENLRAVTRSENQHNHGVHRDNSSGFTGVCFNKQANKYMAQIILNGKHIYLGLYPTAEEAYVAYMLGKIKYHPSSPDTQEYYKELTLAG